MKTIIAMGKGEKGYVKSYRIIGCNSYHDFCYGNCLI